MLAERFVSLLFASPRCLRFGKEKCERVYFLVLPRNREFEENRIEKVNQSCLYKNDRPWENILETGRDESLFSSPSCKNGKVVMCILTEVIPGHRWKLSIDFNRTIFASYS